MKQLRLSAMVTLLLNIALPWAGPLEDGIAAQARGDFVSALKKYQPLAAQGQPDAQYNLALLYGKGQGVTQDYAEAAKWYRLAAAQGNTQAQASLGFMHKAGLGVKQDYVEAVKWYRLAASQGHVPAQFNLGVQYGKGQGVIQDYVRAHLWLNVAAVSGDAEAMKLRDSIARKMTSPQVAEAQKMARECQERKFKGCD